MAIDIDELTNKMIQAGRGLGGNIWQHIGTVAAPELKKIAVQIEALADPASPWSPEEKQLLLRMQVRAAVTMIVALTALVLFEVQKAINAILDAVRDFVNDATGLPLL
jgi:hypothetical protein